MTEIGVSQIIEPEENEAATIEEANNIDLNETPTSAAKKTCDLVKEKTIDAFEWTKVKAVELGKVIATKFMQMAGSIKPETNKEKLVLAGSLYAIGSSGFCIMMFGIMGTFFLLMQAVAFLLILHTVLKHVLSVGLLHFVSPKLRESLMTVSFFDILMSVIVERKLSKLIVAVVSSFMGDPSPEEARHRLREKVEEGLIPKTLYRGIIRKGLMFNLSEKA